MSNLRFDIPAYDQAVVNLTGRVIDGFVSLNPLFDWLGRGKVTRHGGPVRYVDGTKLLDQSMAPVSITSRIDLSVIRSTNIDENTRLLYECAQSFQRGISSEFFRSLDEITDAFGSTTAVSESPDEDDEQLLNWDIILDRLEKAQVFFDEKGQPMLPRLHSGRPQQIEHLRKTMTPEYEQRFRQIIEHKKVSSNVKDCTRRLS